MNSKPQPTALVTGASSGMGKSIAKRLIADGYLVYVAARSTDKMADLAELGAVLPHGTAVELPDVQTAPVAETVNLWE